MRVAVVARDAHSCWLRNVEEAFATDDGGPEAFEAPVHVAGTPDVAVAIGEAVGAIFRTTDSGRSLLVIERLGSHLGPGGVEVEVVTVVSAELLNPDPSWELDRVDFDDAVALFDDVQDEATLVGLGALELDRLEAPEPVWETRQATILEREGRVDGRTLFLGRFDAGPWGEIEMPVTDVPLAEALAWARNYAAHVVLYLGDERYEAGVRPSPNRYPVWDGTVPPRPGHD